MFAFHFPIAPPARSFLTKPDVHGDEVVFTCEGDLWRGNIATGSARRLTSDPGTETYARFSPDGSTIAFTGNYDGGTDVYVIPSDGGAPKRLTYDPAGANVLGWTPDGKNVIFRSRRNTTHGGENKLFFVPATGGLAKEIAVPRGEFASFGPDWRLAYVPVSNEWMNWFDYRAGAADQVWIVDTKGGFKKLAASSGIETTPVWCGPKLFFVSERSGTRNLYALDPNNGKATPITKYTDSPVRYPGADAHRVVFEHGAGLALYDADKNTTTELSFDLASDRIRSREMRVPVAAYAKNPDIGPTGKRILLESRGQIVSVAAENGDFRVLEKKAGTRAMNPVWAPDGKRFAFLSDRSGEYEVWLGDAAGGKEPTQLTHGLAAQAFTPMWAPDGKNLVIVDRLGQVRIIDATTGALTLVDTEEITGSYDATNQQVAFSPDGKTLAYSHAALDSLSTIRLYDLATKRVATVSNPTVTADFPAFSPDGKFLLYIAASQLTPQSSPINGKYYFDDPGKVYMVALTEDAESPFLPKNDEEGVTPPTPPASGTPKPVEIAWDGIADRVIETPIPAGPYTNVQYVPGRILLQSSPQGKPGTVLAFDTDKQTLVTIGTADAFKKSFDNKKLLLRRGNATVNVADVMTGPVAAPPISLAAYTLTLEPEAEWRQIFNESWRIGRDFYYDPKMRGVDWNGVKRKYEAQLPMVGDRGDLTRLLKDMVSELHTGHAYIGGPPVAMARVPMGFLGADYAYEGDALKIVKLYRGDGFAGDRSPLLQPGLKVKEGSYILAIAGQTVRKDQDPQALLVGLAGQTVAILVNDKPSMEGARTIRVKPIASEHDLRYADWVKGRAAYVKEHGGPTLGYAHIPDMTNAGLVGFAKGQFTNTLADGMVYDTRGNGGGYVSSLLLQDIAAKPIFWFATRTPGDWTRENWAVPGYKVAICDEGNFSDGELFVETWKAMKLGPVVGKRTGGGEVGSGGGYALVDGGSIYIPNYGAFTEGKWIIEGVGATPDIEVDQDPAAVMAGKDPQLDKAISLLKEQIAKAPVKRPARPPFTKSYPNP